VIDSPSPYSPVAVLKVNMHERYRTHTSLTERKAPDSLSVTWVEADISSTFSFNSCFNLNQWILDVREMCRSNESILFTYLISMKNSYYQNTCWRRYEVRRCHTTLPGFSTWHLSSRMWCVWCCLLCVLDGMFGVGCIVVWCGEAQYGMIW
jgi:hypothetical protein